MLFSRRAWHTLALIGLFLLAGLIRLKNIQAPGILVEREYDSAIIARNFYFKGNPEIENWRKEVVKTLRERQFILEPPLNEYLVSLVYRLIGREELWFARPLTALYWLIGGVFLYLITRHLLAAGEAFIATAYYLLVPAGILTSRSFQPDAMMMMLFLISLYCIIQYFARPSTPRLLIAAGIVGLTVLLRPLVVFALLGTFTGLTIHIGRTWKAILQRNFSLFLLVSLALPAVYYGNGLFFSGFLREQSEMSFRPYLFLRREFWENWFFMAINEVGLTAFLAALAGFWLIRKQLAQATLLGLLGGYILFAFTFNYHISTHPYYHLQLIPLVGISSAPLLTGLIRTLKDAAPRFWWLPVSASILIVIAFAYKQVSNSLWTQVFEDPSTAREIGEIVQHSERAVFVAYHYGLPLEYYGEFTGTFWPRKLDYWLVPQPGEVEKSVQERLAEIEFPPEYFVITNFAEYATHHQDLGAYLETSCAQLAETDRYLIFHACQQ